MFGIPPTRVWDYVICCKVCHKNVPAPVETMPDQYFAARCVVCGATRNYLPSELFRGRLAYELVNRRASSVRP